METADELVRPGLFFLLYLVGVFGFGLYKSGRISRKGETFTDFFLAGRRLPWYAIGFSLYASKHL